MRVRMTKFNKKNTLSETHCDQDPQKQERQFKSLKVFKM